MLLIIIDVMFVVTLHWPINGLNSIQLTYIVMLIAIYPGAVYGLTQTWKQLRREEYGWSYMLVLLSGIAYFGWYHQGPIFFRRLVETVMQ